MTPDETAALLAYIAVIDNRRVDQVVIGHWQELVGDLDVRDCREAVIEHRKTSTEYLQPAHVRRAAIRLAARRRAMERPAITAPAAFQRTPDQQAYVEAKAAELRAQLAALGASKAVPAEVDQ